MLTNPYFVAVGVPFMFLLLGAICRKLVRGSAWKREDFYLGIDMSLTGISSGLIYVIELLSTKAAQAGCLTAACTQFNDSVDNRLIGDTVYIAVALVGLMGTLTIHQDQDRNTSDPKRKLIFLGLLSNLVGTLLLAVFILYVKGVSL